MPIKAVDIEYEITLFKEQPSSVAAWVSMLTKHFRMRRIMNEDKHAATHYYLTERLSTLSHSDGVVYGSGQSHLQRERGRLDQLAVVTAMLHELDSVTIYERAQKSESKLSADACVSQRADLKKNFIAFTSEFLSDYGSWTRFFMGHWGRTHVLEATNLKRALNTGNLNKSYEDITRLIDAAIHIAQAKSGWNPDGSFARRTNFLKEFLTTLKSLDTRLETAVAETAAPAAAAEERATVSAFS